MGVPKLFSWISARYPCINAIISEQQIPDVHHFYLDMNPIIHACCTPTDEAASFSEEEMFSNIKIFVKFLMQLIRPQKTLFMAVDGVAPRKKMVGQRCGRFRPVNLTQLPKEEMIMRGDPPKHEPFDATLISPGTAFMERLHTCLKRHIEELVRQNNIWQHVDVILSGHDCPGEGEHKIREYISYKRGCPDYLPGEHHCLYGSDADLIFLGLATHEVNTCVLRSNVQFSRAILADRLPFCVTYLSVLREYIDLEFRSLVNAISFPYDLERIVDDWIFMCYFLGNDFTPHIPSLNNISEALLVLWSTYRAVLPRLNGYLVEYGQLNLPRFHQYLEKLYKFEIWLIDDSLLVAKSELAEDRDQAADVSTTCSNPVSPRMEPETNGTFNVTRKFYDENDLYGKLDLVDGCLSVRQMKLLQCNEWYCESAYIPDNLVDLGEKCDRKTCRQFYYRTYFNIAASSDDQLGELLLPVVTDYVRMLQWTLCYYFLRVPDWSFYYRYHYAPFVEDIRLYTKQFIMAESSFSDENADFSWAGFNADAKPVLPFVHQLMILPFDAAYMVPECYQSLITSPDSPLAPYFPRMRPSDTDCSTDSLEDVVVAPYLDESVVLDAIDSVIANFTAEEAARNMHKVHFLFPSTPCDASQRTQVLYIEFPHDFFRNRIACTKNDLRQFYYDTRGSVSPNLPSLHRLDFTVEHWKMPLRNYWEAKNPNILKRIALILKRPSYDVTSIEKIARKLLGRPVCVRWPHCSIVMPVRIMTASMIWELKKFNAAAIKPSIYSFKNLVKRSLHGKRMAPSSIAESEWFNICVDSLDCALRVHRAISLQQWDSTHEIQNDAVLIFSRRLEGWSLKKLNHPILNSFVLIPHFELSRVSSGADLQLAIDDPGDGRFDLHWKIKQECSMHYYGDIESPSKEIKPTFKLCDGLAVDLLDLVVPELPSPRQIGHVQPDWNFGQAVELKSIFCKGLIVFIMDPPIVCQVGEVVDVHVSTGMVSVQPYSQPGHAVDLSPLKGKSRLLQDCCYLTSYSIARNAGLDRLGVSRLTGTILVKRSQDSGEHVSFANSVSEPSSTEPTADQPNGAIPKMVREERDNSILRLGFDLKRNKTHSQVLGWSRFCTKRSEWVFSGRTAKLVEEFYCQFPHIWSIISERGFDIRNPIQLSSDISPENLEAAAELIKSSGCRTAHMAAASATFLDSSMFEEIRSLLTPYDRNSWRRTQPVSVAPDKLFVPGNAASNLNPHLKSMIPPLSLSNGPRRFELLDRVVFCKVDQAVPLGLCGTVIGITSDSPSYSLEVMYDEEFPGAVDLRGSGPRCALMNPCMLLLLPSTRITKRNLSVPSVCDRPNSLSPWTRGYKPEQSTTLKETTSRVLLFNTGHANVRKVNETENNLKQ